MFRVLCNELCIRMKVLLVPIIIWLAHRAGLKVVEAEAVMLPKGFMMFDPALAKEVGLERAVVYQKIKGWQEHNARHQKRSHFRQDRWWTYGRPEWWLEKEFIWSSLSTVRRAFNDLEKAGLMLVDRVNGEWWMSALAGEAVNLTPGASAVQMDLFNLESPVSEWRSSIGKPQSSKQAKASKQPIKRTGARKDAVADFNLPEYRDQVGEIREASETAVDGRDVLAQLPGALVTQWTDAKLPLEALVAQHGADVINATWAKASGFKNQVAGLRTLLAANPPAPVSALPPSPAEDATESDYEEQTASPDDTPIFDIPDLAEDDPNTATWNVVMGQLEIQFDRQTFDAFIKGTRYLREEQGEWVCQAPNVYTRDMLQHRLYREVRRVLRDVRGQTTELRFEVAGTVQA